MNIYTIVRKAARDSILTSLAEFFPTSVEQNKGIIFSHGGGSEPSIPYAVINVLSIEQEGRHITSTLASPSEESGWSMNWGEAYSVGSDYYISVSAFFEVMIQYSFCGSTAGDMAHTFSHRVSNNPLTFLEQQKSKLAFMRKSTIRRAPQKRETGWVENFNIDVTYNYIFNEQVKIDPVEGVVIADETGDLPVIIKIPDTIVYP